MSDHLLLPDAAVSPHPTPSDRDNKSSDVSQTTATSVTSSSAAIITEARWVFIQRHAGLHKQCAVLLVEVSLNNQRPLIYGEALVSLTGPEFKVSRRVKADTFQLQLPLAQRPSSLSGTSNPYARVGAHLGISIPDHPRWAPTDAPLPGDIPTDAPLPGDIPRYLESSRRFPVEEKTESEAGRAAVVEGSLCEGRVVFSAMEGRDITRGTHGRPLLPVPRKYMVTLFVPPVWKLGRFVPSTSACVTQVHLVWIGTPVQVDGKAHCRLRQLSFKLSLPASVGESLSPTIKDMKAELLQKSDMRLFLTAPDCRVKLQTDSSADSGEDEDAKT